MRWLIVNTAYPRLVERLYAQQPELHTLPYDRQMACVREALPGVASYLAQALGDTGQEADVVLANIAPLQRAWAQEHGLRVPGDARWGWRLRKGLVPWPERRPDDRWMYEILQAQIRAYQPEVLYVLCIDALDSRRLDPVRSSVGRLLGQHAAPLPDTDISRYDLIVSSLPNQVAHFRSLGLRSEYLPLAFPAPLMQMSPPVEPACEVAFVGSLGGPHAHGTQLLEAVARRFDLKLWCPDAARIPADSPLRRCHQGAAWGLEMLTHLRQARIVINRHVDAAGPYANNLRLFEATGMGALLVTDYKRNLPDLFTPGSEVAAYRSIDECLGVIEHYLSHESQRTTVAAAGKLRTLAQHTWHHRAGQLLELVQAPARSHPSYAFAA